MTNKEGASEQYKDVVHEEMLRVGASTNAPDYTFRFGGNRVFFVEAKKPAVTIAEDPAPAFQLRRYAWSARLPFSVLFNFAELAVYDTRIRPQARDRAAAARVLYHTRSTSTVVRFWEVLSKDAYLPGRF